MLGVAVAEESRRALLGLRAIVEVRREVVHREGVAEEPNRLGEDEPPIERDLGDRRRLGRCAGRGDLKLDELVARQIRRPRGELCASAPSRLGPVEELARDVAEVVRAGPDFVEERGEARVEGPPFARVHAGPRSAEHLLGHAGEVVPDEPAVECEARRRRGNRLDVLRRDPVRGEECSEIARELGLGPRAEARGQDHLLNARVAAAAHGSIRRSVDREAVARRRAVFDEDRVGLRLPAGGVAADDVKPGREIDRRERRGTALHSVDRDRAPAGRRPHEETPGAAGWLSVGCHGERVDADHRHAAGGRRGGRDRPRPREAWRRRCAHSARRAVRRPWPSESHQRLPPRRRAR